MYSNPFKMLTYVHPTDFLSQTKKNLNITYKFLKSSKSNVTNLGQKTTTTTMYYGDM